ncbi:MAG: 50S ribosome-binding GTPase [Phycisphaeraceae bacterium]|nr:50S ribosome-binding GTPase [Phycisphaeraceae bacterium]
MSAWECTWRLATPPPTGSGAIAAIALNGDVDAALAALSIREVGVGGMALRDLAGVDRGIVARVAGNQCLLMPHAGPAVVRRLIDAMLAVGIAENRAVCAADRYPEAEGEIEAKMLDTLARAASPLAQDLLLDQPRRWALVGNESALEQEDVAARSRLLQRLIEPPLVVTVGPPNIGKSSLLNALAGRGVSLVADESGTTRDHVGALLDLAGLVVRYIDAPGIEADGPDGIAAEARRIALGMARHADLVVLACDGASGLVPWESAAPTLRVALRSDLGLPAAGTVELAVCVRTGEGVQGLVTAIRDRLVPPDALAHPGPWRFW